MGLLRESPIPFQQILLEIPKLQQELAFQRRGKTVRPPGNTKVDKDKDTNGRENLSEVPQREVPNDESKMNEEVAPILLDFSNAAVNNEPDQCNIEAAHMVLELSREVMLDPQPETVETEVKT